MGENETSLISTQGDITLDTTLNIEEFVEISATNGNVDLDLSGSTRMGPGVTISGNVVTIDVEGGDLDLQSSSFSVRDSLELTAANLLTLNLTDTELSVQHDITLIGDSIEISTNLSSTSGNVQVTGDL